MKYVVLAVLLLLVGVALTQIEFDNRTYVPIVRMRTDNGLFLTLVQDRTSRRKACREANERFVGPLGEACRGCTVESTDCAVQPEGIDRALANGEQLPLYTISAEGMRMALLGPPGSVQATCEMMVAQMVVRGLKSAACVFPQLAERQKS